MVEISALVALDSRVTSLNGLMPAKCADHVLASLKCIKEDSFIAGVSSYERPLDPALSPAIRRRPSPA
jgi:hypothetical protein